jgi:hypothetical protein
LPRWLGFDTWLGQSCCLFCHFQARNFISIPGTRNLLPCSWESESCPICGGKRLLVLCPTPKLEDHSLLAVHICIFNICSFLQHLEFVSYIHNLRVCHAVVMINPFRQNTHLGIFIYTFQDTCSWAVAS